MKKILKSVVLVTLALLATSLFGIFAIPSVNCGFPANAIWVEPQTYNATAEGKTTGDQFTISVWINVTGLFGFEYKLRWNNTLLHHVTHTYYLPTVWGTNFFVAKDQITTGQYWFAASALNPAPPFTGAMKVLDITFEIAYQPYYPEPDMSCTLDLVDDKLGDRNGNPILHTTYDGEYIIEALPPITITNVVQYPQTNIQPTDTVKVNATVISVNPIKNVTLYYSIDDGATWTDVNMTLLEGNIYSATIPPQSAGTSVKYKIVAYDTEGNMAVEDNAGEYYVYTVVPEFPMLATLMLLITTVTMTLILTKKRKFRMSRNN